MSITRNIRMLTRYNAWANRCYLLLWPSCPKTR